MSRMSFAERDRETIRRINILSEALSLGLVLPNGATASEAGWIRCHAIGREDKNPSGSLNVGDGPDRGRYLDYARDERSVSFFEFAARSGKFLDWRAARDHYSTKHGLRPAPREFKKGRFFEFKQAVTVLARGAGKELNSEVIGQPDVYSYQLCDGTESFVVLKFRTANGGKTCRPLHETPEGWQLGLPKERVLYRLPQLLAADPSLPVLFVEGEKDAGAAAELGFIVTTNVNGSKSWRDTYAEQLRDRAVVIICDNDEAGRALGERVGQSLTGIASSTRIIRAMPGVPEKGDLSDWITAGGTAEALQKLLDSAEEFVAQLPVAKPSAESAAPTTISNAIIIENEESKEYKPKGLSVIAEEIYQQSDGWPRRVGDALFTISAVREVQWIQRPPDLMSYLGEQCEEPPLILERAGFHSKAEILAYLKRNATAYKAIQGFPHEPLVSNTFYNCDIPDPGSGQRLQEFLNFFVFATELDRSLYQAFLMTAIWGGEGGKRPAFLYTADSGQGAGKTTAVKMAASIFGGAVELRINEDPEVIRKRLLSVDALLRRIVVFDNVTSENFNSPELASLITAKTVNGWQLYKGDGNRPNLLTYCLTVNGAALGTDLAQRVVTIKLGRPIYSADWQEDVEAFIEKHRWEIIADLIGALRVPASPLASYSRWGSWERSVLCRLPAPADLQRLILERQQESNVENEEFETLISHIEEQLTKRGFQPDLENVFIPNAEMTEWFCSATGERANTTKVSRTLKQLAKVKNASSAFPIVPCTRLENKRGHIWVGKESTPSAPVNTRLATRKETFQSPYRPPEDKDTSARPGDTWATL